MANKKLAKALKQTGGVRDMVDVEALKTLSEEEMREQLFLHRDSSDLTTQEAIANDNKRLTQMQKMGFDFFDIDSLDPHPQNNYSINPDEVKNLAASIYETGITTPIIIREKPDGRYEILGGERRWSAHKLLVEQHGEVWRMIPGRNLGNIDDEQALFILHSDNLNQRELTPTERAYGFEVVYDRISKQRAQDPVFKEECKGKKTYEILAEQFHVSVSTVKNEVSISRNLQEEGKKLLDEGRIGKNQAAEVSRLADEQQQVVIEAVGSNDLESDEIDHVISSVKSGEGSAENAVALAAKTKKLKDANYYLKSAHRNLRKAHRTPGETDYVLIGQIKQLMREIEMRNE